VASASSTWTALRIWVASDFPPSLFDLQHLTSIGMSRTTGRDSPTRGHESRSGLAQFLHVCFAELRGPQFDLHFLALAGKSEECVFISFRAVILIPGMPFSLSLAGCHLPKSR
jgi:hypothetical protein